jgi:nucleoid-associated protein YgaU
MRTDAKIGFAIGGVLLAVLTVYAIVVPKHKKAANTVALVKNDTPTGADTPAPTPLLGGDGSSSGQQPVGPLKDTPVPPHTDPIHTDVPHSESSHGEQARGDVQPGPVLDPLSGREGNMGGGNGAGTDLTRRDDHKPSDDRIVARPGPVDHAKPPHVAKPIPPYEVSDNSATADRLYTIQSGQTLSKIAYEVYGNARFYVAIQRENRGLDPDHLKVGMQIKLPEISPVPAGGTVVSDDRVVERATNRAAERASEGVTPPSEMSRTPTHSVAAADGRTYTVQSGDNLYAIARKLLGSGRKSDLIYNMNKDLIGPDKSRLKLGMVLKLPESARAALAE